MTQEGDRLLYIDLFKILYDFCECDDDERRSFYQTAIEEIEARYDEDTTRKWVEDVDLND